VTQKKPILFNRWPGLAPHVPWVALGATDSPVERMVEMGAELGHSNLWIKRDDTLGHGYGGNKARKLEFSLARVLRSRRRKPPFVVTAGGVGSNHVTATSIYANRRDIDVAAVLAPQPVQENLRTNLLAMLANGAELYPEKSETMAYVKAAWLLLSEPFRSGRWPYLLWIGGSSVFGLMGIINLALEIEKQVASGLMPEPKYIVLPVGSTGTLAGLAAGLKLTGLKTIPYGVRVYSRGLSNEWMVRFLANRVLRRLRRYERDVPRVRVRYSDFKLDHNYFGSGYARYTQDGVVAMDIFRQKEGIGLEGTYTGKAAAAFIDIAESERDPVLFLNTYNSHPMGPHIEDAPPVDDLPPILKAYFTSPVAPVDQGDKK